MLQSQSSLKKLSGALALVLSLVLVVAMACGGDKEEPTQAPAPATAVPATAAPAPTATPEPEPGGGGTLIVANDLIGPKVFRPSLVTGGGHSAFGLQDWGFYDFLLQADHSSPLVFGEVGDLGYRDCLDCRR